MVSHGGADCLQSVGGQVQPVVRMASFLRLSGGAASGASGPAGGAHGVLSCSVRGAGRGRSGPASGAHDVLPWSGRRRWVRAGRCGPGRIRSSRWCAWRPSFVRGCRASCAGCPGVRSRSGPAGGAHDAPSFGYAGFCGCAGLPEAGIRGALLAGRRPGEEASEPTVPREMPVLDGIVLMYHRPSLATTGNLVSTDPESALRVVSVGNGDLTGGALCL